jgi:hypothetical protein
MAQEVRDVVLMYVRGPEPCGEGVAQGVKVEVLNARVCDRLLKAVHQLAAFPSGSFVVEDALIIGRVLTQSF